MTTIKKLAPFAVLLALPAALLACGVDPAAQSSGGAISPARQTIDAGNAAVAQVAPQLTIAVATDTRAGQLTATAQWEAQVAATAQAAQTQAADATATAVAAGQATATQHATETQIAGTAVAATATLQAAQTATAWPPAATQTQAAVNEVARLDRQRQLEADLRLAQTVAFAFLGVAAVVLVMLGTVHAYRKLLPALNIWLRRHRGPDGTVFAFGDGDDVLDLLIPERSLGPGLRRTAAGVETQGLAADPDMQERVTSKALLVNLARAMPPGRAGAVRHLIKPALKIDGPQSQPPVGTEGDVVDAEYRVVEPAEMRGWLDEIKLKLLQSGERDAKAGEGT